MKIGCSSRRTIPQGFTHIATNKDGVINAFVNAPVRDFNLGVWIDSVTGDYGTLIECDTWDQSVKSLDTTIDSAETMKKVREKKIKRIKWVKK